MRPIVIICLIAALVLSGCAEQRHTLAQIWRPNRTDEDGQPLPRWVRYEDFEDKHPNLIVTGTVIVVAMIVVAALTGCLIVKVSEPHDRNVC